MNNVFQSVFDQPNIMYDEKPKIENIIISKKSQRTGDEDHHQKKGKKHKKNVKQEKPVVEIEQPERKQRTQPFRKPMMPAKNSSLQSDQKILADLCAVLTEHKTGTILKILKETDFDKEQALNRLLQMPPDNQEKQAKKQEDLWHHQFEGTTKSTKNESENNSSSQAPSEVAFTLMNEVFDTLLKEEINGRQFQELFEEIAYMIKEDQREKGVGVIEINNLVDQCYSIKQTLLVGFRQELSNFDDFQFDQASPLYAQIQQFVQDLIGKQVKQEKRRQEDFPMLGMGGGKKNIIEKIKQENKKKKEEQHFFTPSRVLLPKFARQKNNQMSIFNVDNKLTSEKDLISLHKQFLDVPIIDLKFIYKALAGDYNICREFLIKHYKRNTKFIRQIKTVTTYNHNNNTHKMSHSLHKNAEEIDQQLRHLTLDQIRHELDHLYKLRQAFKLTKMKIKSTNSRKQVDRICNSRQPLIKKLSLAARVKTVQLMAKNDPSYVDLHGYREEQIDDLLEAITRMINELFNMGNQKVKTKMVRGRKTACLVVMTGKGIHSRGNKSVLKPVVQSWCSQNGVDFDQQSDHIKVYILIK